MKIVLAVLCILVLISCKSQRDECIEGLMKENDYDYESACEACDEEASAINHY
jgi:hypothetical protein